MYVPDCLYPSDNLYDIPCLRLDMQAGNLVLPFAPYGTGRKNRRAATLHFYSKKTARTHLPPMWKPQHKNWRSQSGVVAPTNRLPLPYE